MKKGNYTNIDTALHVSTRLVLYMNNSQWRWDGSELAHYLATSIIIIIRNDAFENVIKTF